MPELQLQRRSESAQEISMCFYEISEYCVYIGIAAIFCV
jgi:hypothetical protein